MGKFQLKVDSDKIKAAARKFKDKAPASSLKRKETEAASPKPLILGKNSKGVLDEARVDSGAVTRIAFGHG